MRNKAIKYLLSPLLKKQCPSTIPRSGEEGERVNCYSISVVIDGKPTLLVRKITDEYFQGLWWNGDKYDDECCLHFKHVQITQIKIRHYNGLYTTIYSGLIDYLLTGATGYERTKVFYNRTWTQVSQFFFNRRKLVTLERLQILRLLISRHIESDGKEFSSMDLMSDIYTIKWILHPEREKQEKKIELYLESLAETGELKKVETYNYVVTGKSIVTLSQYEENERRHRENKRIQFMMALLTIALILVGLVQAYVSYRK